jgi:tRNA threonylcarbamoyladenosine modification (KEOPS) complex Cgi121 subunit
MMQIGAIEEFSGIKSKLDDAQIKEASAKFSINALVHKFSKPKSDGEIILLLDPAHVISRNHIQAAYSNALFSFNDNENMSKNIGIEIMMFMSFTKQIKDAIAISGAKDNSHFVLFCSNMSALKKAQRYIKIKKEFNPSKKEQVHAAKQFGLKSYSADSLLYKMASLKLSD